MKLAIMQPYFFPYIGYFQLMNYVNEFVVYDNIQYSKQGWINRNRILFEGNDTYITIPIKKSSDYLDIREREISDEWIKQRKRIAANIYNAYSKSKYFEDVFPMIEDCLMFNDRNLFNFLFNSINVLNNFIGIKTKLTISSTIPINHKLTSESKVIEICKERRTDEYINPIGGINLYNVQNFKENGVKLHFFRSNDIIYRQFDYQFVPNLSIIDVLMLNDGNTVKEFLSDFSLL